MPVPVTSYPWPEVSLALKTGPRHWSFRHELLDKNLVLKKPLKMISASIDHNNLADKVKRTCTYQIPASEGGSINFASDHIRSFARLQMPDGGWHEFAVGTFMLASNGSRYVNERQYQPDGTSISVPKQDVLQVTGYDRLLIFAEDAYTTRFDHPAGLSYRGIIMEVIYDTLGHTDVDVVYDNTLLPNTLEWPPGTPKLNIINDAIGAINFTTLATDGMGRFFSQPYVAPDEAPILWEYKVDRESLIIPGVDVDLDLFNVPNTFVGYISDPDKPPLRSVYVNSNPASLTSTVSRGRSIVQVIEPDRPEGNEELDQPATQALLDAKVQRIAQEATQQFMIAKFNTAIMPIHGDGDVCLIDYGQGLAPFREHQWSMELKAGGSMSHEFRRVVSI